MSDETIELIRKIYAQPVPLQSELKNPFNSNARRKKKLNPSLDEALSENVEEWDYKDFCKYFAQKYKEALGGFYKITYISDGVIIRQISDFMEDNKLDKNLHTKAFIDWAFQNKTLILKENGFILLYTIKNYLNRYYQEKIYIEQKQTSLIDIFDDIQLLEMSGKHKEIYSRFGIPISATYFVYKKNVPVEAVSSNLRMLFEMLNDGNSEQKNLLELIFQKSINRSPYIPEMKLLDWREQFSDLIEKYKKDNWWRDDDYPGIPRFDFKKLTE